MRNKKIICLLAAGLGALLLTGCGGENQKTYEQANADLEQGNYDYALNEYQTCISAGYKLSQSYRGSGIVKLRTGDYQGAIDDLTSALNDEKTRRTFWNIVPPQSSKPNFMTRQWQTARLWPRIIH